MSKNNLVTDLVCVRTFWGSEDILASPHNLSFKFYGGLNIEARYELRFGVRSIVVKVRVRVWVRLSKTMEKEWKSM